METAELPAFPRLRDLRLEVVSQGQSGRDALLWSDPRGLAAECVMEPALWLLLQACDGKHSLDDLCALARREEALGWKAPETLAFLLEAHEALLFETPRARQLMRERDPELFAPTSRPAALAGRAYPNRAQDLRAGLGEKAEQGRLLFEALRADGPGHDLGLGPVSAIVTPHIDFGRGGHLEALSYLPLVEEVERSGQAFDTLVVLGIAHSGLYYPFCALERDFETPLGSMLCDRAFVQGLARRLGERLEFEGRSHEDEHSIEFVAVWTRFFEALVPARIVPILCGSLPLSTDDDSPLRDHDVLEFAAALRDLVRERQSRGEKIGIVLSVDGAHVGTPFGDSQRIDPESLAEVEAADRQWCAHFERGDAQAFHQHFARTNNRFRVDAHPALLTALLAFPQWRSRLLALDRAFDPKANSLVSFAALACHEPARRAS